MYASTAKQNNFDELLKRHAPLVKRIAYHLGARLPASVLADDLIQAGMIGLLEAARNYDSTQGASFETYAGIRIRGAMLDELRKNDWAPKSVHRKAREVMEAVRTIENRTGRDARDDEIAKALNISLDEYYKILLDSSSSKMLNFDETFTKEEDSDHDLHEHPHHIAGPMEAIQNDDLKRTVGNAISQLPEREKLVVTLYYAKELNLREIGEVLRVSESRISQLLSQALIRLRSRLADY